MAQRQFRSDDTVWWPLKFGDGNQGAWTSSSSFTWNPTRTGCSGSASSTTLALDSSPAFNNGEMVIIHQTQHASNYGKWELNQISSGGGSSTLTMSYTLCNDYNATEAQVVRIYQYTDFTLQGAHTITAPAWDGNDGGIMAIACTGTCTIAGTITAKGRGLRGCTGGNVGNRQDGHMGEGVASTTYNQDASSANSRNATSGGCPSCIPCSHWSASCCMW